MEFISTSEESTGRGFWVKFWCRDCGNEVKEEGAFVTLDHTLRVKCPRCGQVAIFV